MSLIKCVKCKDCGKPFYMKDENEYILSYCDGCRKLVVIYKINPAVLFKEGDNDATFVSSDAQSKCRKCGSLVTIKNKNDYFSIRCVNCGFGIVYRMETHCGIGRFIGGEQFDKNVYWTTGKRKQEREERDARNKC